MVEDSQQVPGNHVDGQDVRTAEEHLSHRILVSLGCRRGSAHLTRTNFATTRGTQAWKVSYLAYWIDQWDKKGTFASDGRPALPSGLSALTEGRGGG